MLTAHEIYVPLPQAFIDLVTLAAGLEEFQSDPRMSAVLEACEALVGGAEASPAPAHPEESTCEVVKAAYAAEEGGGNA
jgi:hypothetical protein